MNREDYIAVFDSGVGGVSVLKELMKLMPRERFYYFGDSVNAPYGLKSTEEVRALTVCAAEKLFSLGCKALVVACNTATAAAIDTLRNRWPDRIIVGIEPAIKLACDRHPGGTIGLMATNVTLREQKLTDLIQRCRQDCDIQILPSPGVVELVEAGKSDSEEAIALMQKELGSYIGALDAIVLGCTHYPFMKQAIRQVIGTEVELLDGSIGTARETLRRLKNADLCSSREGALIVENSSPDSSKIQLVYDLLKDTGSAQS